MDESGAVVWVEVFLGLLAVCVTVVSILVLKGGKLYKKIPESFRPRRWFVAIFFSYFIVFCLWFGAWYFQPGSIAARILSFGFGAFTIFMAAWYALGRVAGILQPIIRLIQNAIDAYQDRTEARKR